MRFPVPVAARAACAASAVLAACAPPSAGRSAPPASLALARVNVVDVERGLVLDDHTVVVVGNRIRSVAPSARARVPSGARVVNAAGKYLVPGLWDMHAHALQDSSGRAEHGGWGQPEHYFPLLVAHGITGIRDMHADAEDPLGQLRRYRAEVGAGRVLGPRIVGGGFIVDGPVPRNTIRAHWVTTEGEARRAVDSLAAGGADFVKVYTHLSRPAYFTILDQARRRGLPAAGHIPLGVTAAEASDAGQRSIEHLRNVPEACTPDEGALVRAWEDADRDPRNRADAQRFARARAPRDRASPAFQRRVLERHDAARCRALFERFRRNGTWHMADLVNWRAQRLAFEGAAPDDPRLRYVPASVRAEWDSAQAREARRLSPEDRALAARFYEHLARLAGELHRAGVGLLSGTDFLGPHVHPGSGLHDNLHLLVRDAGLPPLEALRTATLGPARFLGAADSLGTVAAGKVADLVLLEGDPLADVRNTARIAGVVLNGRYLDRGALDGLLALAERAARSVTP